MRLCFDAREAALRNSPGARLREGTRFAMLAHAARTLGHDATLVPNRDLVDSPRWGTFRPLQSRYHGDAEFIVTNATPGKGNMGRVALKTTEDCRYDEQLLGQYAAVVCEEYDPKWADHPRLLPTPYFIHDSLVGMLIDQGLYEEYIHDDLFHIRERYGWGSLWDVGYFGAELYGRRAAVETFAAMYEGSTVRWYTDREEDRMSPEEYIRQIGRSLMGIHIAGNTPKANRFSEIVMMGRAVITVPCPIQNKPPVTAENVVLLKDWSDAETVHRLTDDARDKIVEAADRDYVAGWSPRGVVKQLVSMLGG